jgi:8-oxo-dGTP pyrophosphatase MutT (NUDIX family)
VDRSQPSPRRRSAPGFGRRAGSDRRGERDLGSAAPRGRGGATPEAPAGIFDREQEPGHELARRELEEETGYRATRLEHLGTIYTSPGFTDEAIELFLAEAEPGGQPEEGIEVVAMEFGEALAAVVDGRIRDAKTALAILLARARIT